VDPHPAPIPRTLLAATLLAAAGALLFGLKGVVVKLAYAAGAEPTGLLAWRLLLALPCFALVLLWVARRDPRPVGRGDLLAAAAWGIVGFHVASWINFLGLERIGAGLERIILFIYPALVVGLSALRDGRRPAPGLLAAAAVTWVGIIVAWWHHARLGDADPLGVALVAASAVVFAGFMTGSEAMIHRVGSQRAMAVGMVAAAGGMTAQALLTSGIPLPTPAGFGWALVLALACTVAPVVLQAAALGTLGAARLAVVSTVGPVGTLLVAWAALGEDPGALGALGAAITIAGGAWCGLAGKGRRSG
jgi:drug/metabolite transporter (DMT)-like permease